MFQLVMYAVRVEHEDRVIGDALDDHPKAPFAFHQRLLRLAALGDVVPERVLDAFLLLDLGLQDIAGVLERSRCAHRPCAAVVVRALQILLGVAAVGDVLRDRHEVAHRAVLVGRSARRGSCTQLARAVGQHLPAFGDEPLAGVDCVLRSDRGMRGRSSGSARSCIRICSSSAAGRWTISQKRSLTSRSGPSCRPGRCRRPPG